MSPSLTWFVSQQDLTCKFFPLVFLSFPIFSCVFLSISYSPLFATSFCLPFFTFYSLMLVGWSSLFFHFTHISTFIRIPRDPHSFRGFPWNVFQTQNIVWQRTSPMALPVLGYRPCHARVLCQLPPSLINVKPTTWRLP